MNNLEAIEEIELQESDEIAGCNCLGCAVGVLCAGCAGCIACTFPPSSNSSWGFRRYGFCSYFKCGNRCCCCGRECIMAALKKL